MKSYEIRHEVDHYVVYIDDEVYCTADTYSEGFKEVQDYIYLHDEGNDDGD